MSGSLSNRLLGYFAATMVIVAALAIDMPAREISAETSQIMSAAPEFTHAASDEWINSPPLTLESLRGKVVLIDFWTYDCWNCYRSFPWLNALEEKYRGRGLTIVGVHSPEFDRERQRNNVLAKVKEFQLLHPIMLDNNFSYWDAMNNRYWPAYYLLDRQGRIRGAYIGETHAGSRKARTIEKQVLRLIDEKS